jgi:sialic acid synthase SpsE
MVKDFKIGSIKVGEGSPVYIIAEIGSNHDGSLERAKELITLSKKAGADAVKFQSFTAEGLFNPLRPTEGSTPENILAWETHPAYKVIEGLTLPEAWHSELKEFAGNEGITFLSAPFDDGRAELLNSLGVEAFKIASGDITNIPLLKKVASFKKPVILSTGASFLGEVEEAILAIREAGNTDIALLHCVSLYPPDFSEVNLLAMKTMADAFSLTVGISDHTPGSTVALGAVALGAKFIEKHITTDNSLPGPDHPYAMTVEGFSDMVKEVRTLEASLGDGLKRPTKSEVGERIGARRSVYATVDIPEGAELTAVMLKSVRHAYGIEPKKQECLVGMRTKRLILANSLVSWDDIER